MRTEAEGREAILAPFCPSPSPSRPEHPAYASRLPFSARADARPRHASPEHVFLKVLLPTGPLLGLRCT